MKAANVGLEDFMDWTIIISNEPAKEKYLTLPPSFRYRCVSRLQTRRVRPPPELVGNGPGGLL